MSKSLKQWLGVFLRGFAMGAADVVPGVSGGTIAFITGIYARLISAISRIDAECIKLILAFKWKQAWAHVDANFLLCLFAGILTSIISLSHVISFLLENHPILVWSFFVGLVIASGIVLLKEIALWQASTVALLILGIVAALFINMLRPQEVDPSLFYVFICGMIAICAMLVPGISGSFLLLILGVYPVVLNAIKSFEVSLIAVFAAGALIGLLSFAKLLNWALNTAKSHIFSLLTGFLLGSSVLIWPWKLPTNEMLGDEPRLVNVSPMHFAAETGEASQIVFAIVLSLSAAAIVLILGRFKPE